MFGLEVIARHLVGDKRQETADQPHIVIPWQPADHAVAAAHIHRRRMTRQIVEQRAMRHRDTGGEAGRSAGILKIADVVRLRRGQRAFRRVAVGETLPVDPFAALFGGGRLTQFGDLFRVEQDRGIAARQLHGQLIDIAVLAPEPGGQRQGHRPCAGIDRTAEHRGKLRAGFSDQRHAIARFDACGAQAESDRNRIVAQFGKGVGAFQIGAHVVEIQPLLTARGIIHRIGESREIRSAAGQGAIVGRRFCGFVRGPIL